MATCKLCHKKGIQPLAHYRNEHPDYMARKSRDAPRCECGKRRGHRGEHKKGSKLARVPPEQRARARREVERRVEALRRNEHRDVPEGHYCPMCGRLCGGGS